MQHVCWCLKPACKHCYITGTWRAAAEVCSCCDIIACFITLKYSIISRYEEDVFLEFRSYTEITSSISRSTIEMRSWPSLLVRKKFI
jgi:hypothetical protein